MNIHTLRSAPGPGLLANLHGTDARSAVESLLTSSGHLVERDQVVGETIYGTPARVPFIASACRRCSSDVIVEVVSQSSRGSADQKFPYLVENIKTRYNLPTIVVLIGEGFSKGSLEWLRAQVDGKRLLAVMTLEHAEQRFRHALAG